MAKKPLPSPETLRQLLRYEPETGKLFWLPRGTQWFSSDRSCNSWNARDAGTEALTSVMPRGHLQGIILGKQLLAHRVAWAIYYGDWPIMDIDHINCIPSDNRILNLRLATASQNQSNKFAYTNNKSGFKGVTWFSPNRKWVAKIRLNGRLHHLGYFLDPEEAARAYQKAADEMHGDFAKY